MHRDWLSELITLPFKKRKTAKRLAQPVSIFPDGLACYCEHLALINFQNTHLTQKIVL